MAALRPSHMRTSPILVLFALLLVPHPAQAQRGYDFGRALEQARQSRERRDLGQAVEVLLEASKHIDAQTAQAARKSVLEALLATCKQLVEKRSYEPAVRGLSALLVLTADNPLGPGFSIQVRLQLDQLAMTLVLGAQPDLAIRALLALMADGPGPPMRWALLSRAYLESGQIDRATDTLRRGLDQFPSSPELLFVRATLSGSLSEQAIGRANYGAARAMLEQAAADLERACELETAAPGIWRALGKIRGSLWVYYRATGHFDEAVEMQRRAEHAYLRASELDPDNPDALFELGELLMAAEDWAWAREIVSQSRWRYQRLKASPDLGAELRTAIEERIQTCERHMLIAVRRRALQAALRGRFGRARQLVYESIRTDPAARQRSHAFLHILGLKQRAFQLRVQELESRTGHGDSQVMLGDLWMQAGRYDLAREPYLRALDGRLEHYTQAQIEDRLYGTRDLHASSERIHSVIGEQVFELDLCPQLDAGRLHGLLEKAHAMNMGVFPHQLLGPLQIKVFANRRAFLERGGGGLDVHQQGVYAFGQVCTYHEPHRGQAEWLDILAHEIAHRYIDEMSYARSPRWLSEGLALWTSQGWPKRCQRRFAGLRAERKLTRWRDLERRFREQRGNAHELNRLYLQSHQMVAWLVDRFGREQLISLLAAFRQGKKQDEAIQMAYRIPARVLEGMWIQE
ncbi:MAG: tetratricopeptide repeat protein [Deltaproteobacteria bacterium]|nr:tetratricopeptide repeat protein [Deltaproteobacteria bacterium]